MTPAGETGSCTIIECTFLNTGDDSNLPPKKYIGSYFSIKISNSGFNVSNCVNRIVEYFPNSFVVRISFRNAESYWTGLIN